MQEGRAREEPPVLLVDEEARAGHDKGERHRQLPEAVSQLAVHEAELRRAGEHERLRPRPVREHVDRRARIEDHHGPQEDAHEKGDARPQVGAPLAAAPDVVSDDRLGEDAEPEEHEPHGEHPVHDFGGRLHLVALLLILEVGK